MTKLSTDDKEKIYDLVVNQNIPAKKVIDEHYPNITRQTISSVVKKLRLEKSEKITEIFSEENDEEYDDNTEEDDKSSVFSEYLPKYEKTKKENIKIINTKQEEEQQSNFKPPPQNLDFFDKMISGNVEIKNQNTDKPNSQVENFVRQEIKVNPKRFEFISRIEAYIDKFSYKLDDVIGNNPRLFKEQIKTYTDEELENLLDTIRTKISCSGLRSGIHQIFFTGTSVIENIAIQNNFKLQGYSEALSKNDNL